MSILYTIFFIIIQRLYWADSGLNQVASYDLDLDMTSVVYKQQSANFYGISIFKVSQLLQFVNYKHVWNLMLILLTYFLPTNAEASIKNTCIFK